ncbi:MAG: hypothetical protein M9954_02285 [Cyclobacteriaceae bacterium]|nr:hypothetical protein [Cyclobacteriaceae bacterium]
MQRVLTYKDGLPEGKTMVYNESGTLVQEGGYHLGKEHGEWRFYSMDGILEYKGNYKNGEPSGVWYAYTKGKERVYKRYKN